MSLSTHGVGAGWKNLGGDERPRPTVASPSGFSLLMLLNSPVEIVSGADIKLTIGIAENVNVIRGLGCHMEA
jgi:hypothetical protein